MHITHLESEWISCLLCVVSFSWESRLHRQATCNYCGKFGHLARVCHLSTQSHKETSRPRDFSNSPMDINKVVPVGIHVLKLCIDLHIMRKSVTLQVDMGAMTSLLSSDTHQALGFPMLGPAPGMLVGYSGHPMPLLGSFVAEAMYQNVSRVVPFMVINSVPAMNVFGLNTFHALGFPTTDSVCLVSDQIMYDSLSQVRVKFMSLFVMGLGVC